MNLITTSRKHVKIPIQRLPNEPTKVIIYVLCFNTTTYKKSKQIYAPYLWARPILMKYQDYTFENAFWKQLLEISNEWENCDMVGTISHNTYLKMNISRINYIIINKLYDSFNYYAFKKYQNITLFYDIINTVDHNTKSLLTYMHKNLNNTTDYHISFSNYWITTPNLMKQFINWYTNVCLPLLLTHPACLYEYNYDGHLTHDQLIQLWGKPYYPIAPFILERINTLFFYNLDKYAVA